VVAYAQKGHATGPTLSGCRVSSDGKTVTLSFNKTQVADAITIQPHYKGGLPGYARSGSKMEVLVNESLFCMQHDNDQQAGGCRDDGTGHNFTTPFVDEDVWQTVDIAGTSSSDEVVVDLSKVNGGTAFAIRYAWTGDCCSEDPPTSGPCKQASCPLMGAASKLPANPFIAHIVDGKCKCVAPQTCDE
jgi:hypothetical protein